MFIREPNIASPHIERKENEMWDIRTNRKELLEILKSFDEKKALGHAEVSKDR